MLQAIFAKNLAGHVAKPLDAFNNIVDILAPKSQEYYVFLSIFIDISDLVRQVFNNVYFFSYLLLRFYICGVLVFFKIMVLHYK